MHSREPVAALAIVIVLLGACAETTPTTATSTTQPEPTTTTTEEQLEPAGVYARVSPSVAFIETSISTGSGFLTDGGRLLTNAHVVWPFDRARVVFPNRTEIMDAPVVQWDVMADLAVLDLSGIADLPEPTTLGDGENLPVGSELYLIGYPAEVEEFPQPTLTRGILSRVRTWEAIDVTYLQTDATISGGQSGGALVSSRGEVIGISGLLFADGFALAASSPDVLRRIDALSTGAPLDGLGTRLLSGGDSGFRETSAELVTFLDEVTWVFTPEPGDSVEFEVTSAGDVTVAVVSPDGYVEAFADETTTGSETTGFEAAVSGPHVLAVGASAPDPMSVHIAGDVLLTRFLDPDHGRRIRLGRRVAGNIDYPTDVDFFLLDLEEGETVTIDVDTVNFDADLVVALAGGDDKPLAEDADSGGGVLGTNPSVTFTAPQSATYLLGVFDQTGVGPGGYFLTATRDP